MYFQSHLNKVFHYLSEETRADIIDKVKFHDGAILYYNKAIDVINVAGVDTGIGDLVEILPIAIFTNEDFEFADTNRELINTMSNETLSAFMVDKVLNDKGSIYDYLSERSELSTYNLAKITNVRIENDHLRIGTSTINRGIIEEGDKILIAPIEGSRYQAIVTDIVQSVIDLNKVSLFLDFVDSDNVPISIIQKLNGVGIKLAPKSLNANATSNPAEGGNNVLGEGMVARRRNGGFVHI